MAKGGIHSQITFLYFKDLDGARSFFEDLLGLCLVEDQGWAKIYRVCGSAFIGIVDEARGSLRANPDSAVLVTLAVDDVDFWYRDLRERGARIVKELQTYDEIGVRCFFVEGPEDYLLEIQQFLRPQARAVFHRS